MIMKKNHFQTKEKIRNYSIILVYAKLFYIHENNYYLISNYNRDNNAFNKMKDKPIPEDSTIKLVMYQILSSII